MSTLKRLCFVLPLDSEEIHLSNNHQKPPNRSLLPNSKPKQNLSSYTRRAALWFTNHCQLCGRHDQKAYEFKDIAGTDDHIPTKDVANGNPRIFSYAELYIGTNGFSDKEVLGKGGFGRVYRAVLPSDGTDVAVKRVAGRSGERFEKAFVAELAAVAQLRHRNLVRLRGWCVHEDDLLLVYDYMPNLSLDRVLFTSSASSSPPLKWVQRRKIIRGLAAALFYLHEQLDTQIIHRDVKSSNVMLDSEFNARLGDFGLARWIEHATAELGTPAAAVRLNSGNNNTFQFRLTDTSRIGGTIGYLPPESFQRKSGGATAKSDVFSFGIVVLELATGRRAVDLTYPDDQIFMLDWVRRMSDEGRLKDVGDRKLQHGSYPLLLLPELTRTVHLGLLCSLHDPRSRPTMKWIVENLSSDGGDLGDLPALPSFKSLPKYISFSSSSSSSTTASTTTDTTNSDFSNSKSVYVTAVDSTVFVTADPHGGNGNGNGSGGSNSGNSKNSQRSIATISNIDTPRQIPYREIVAITGNFSESRMVAELDFGTGYEGHLESKHVLVKRLGMKTCPALRTRFANELSNLARLRHRNLVQLRGWCTEQGEMLVVYDYSTTRLLSNYLFKFNRNNYVLPWHHRYNIIKSLASAVVYLHEEWEEKVIHRNITSSAIFLDHDMNPRLGCFALAEFLSRNEHGDHHVVTSSARGIFGYMSPEYIGSGVATTMADVYSFGVVVLEIVSGMAAVDFRLPDVLLVKKVHNFGLIGRPLEELVDRRLDGKFDRREMLRLLKLGVVCTRSDPDSRPGMRQIVSILDGNDEILNAIGDRKGLADDWEEKNETSLNMVRRIKALGIH